MKVGDIVQIRNPGSHNGKLFVSGIILKIFDRKCWRTFELGPSINWDLINPEPHAEVMTNKDIINIPVVDLVIVE